MRKVLIMLLAFMAYLGHAQQHKALKIWQGTPERAASVTLTPYIPQGAGRDCPAVIVCPGGSYHWLDTRTECEAGASYSVIRHYLILKNCGDKVSWSCENGPFWGDN